MNRQIKFIWILVFLFSCSLTDNAFNYNYNYLYDADQNFINPKYKVFHNDNQNSTLYFELKSDDILYGKIHNDTNFAAKLKLKYRLFKSKAMKVLVDSSTIELTNLGSNKASKTLQSSTPFKAPIGELYFMEVRFRDVIKDLNVVNTFFVDKRPNLNSQFFLLKSNGSVLIEEIQHFDKAIQLEKSKSIEENKFVIEQSSQQFNLTPPPFIKQNTGILSFNVDTAYTFQFKNHKTTITNYRAINRIKPEKDTSNLYSYFFYLGNAYPEISRLDEMIAPIRYISTSNEYKELKTATNKKVALDNFWLKLAKDEERAKKVLKEYYKRVEIANHFFTDYKEGWKTDRGIIYIIYGNPTSIYKSVDEEVWLYGEENNILSIRYQFYRRNNDLTFNDYQLLRDVEYKNNWYRAVDLWRQAKIY